MIRITEESNRPLVGHAGVEARGALGKIVLPITRGLRIKAVMPHLGSGERMLDIGCSDGYFLRQVDSYAERIGIDVLYGEDANEPLPFPDGHFDLVTMLAVVEHLENPQATAAEICRVLKPGGKWIFTTPKQAAEKLISIYASNVEEQHEMYFDKPTVEEHFGELFALETYETFIFGLNQLFVMQAR